MNGIVITLFQKTKKVDGHWEKAINCVCVQVSFCICNFCRVIYEICVLRIGKRSRLLFFSDVEVYLCDFIGRNGGVEV